MRIEDQLQVGMSALSRPPFYTRRGSPKDALGIRLNLHKLHVPSKKAFHFSC